MNQESGGELTFVLYKVQQSGKKFGASISIEFLVRLLTRGFIPVGYNNLLIDKKKSMEMAFKILIDELVLDDVIWNVRKEEGYKTIVYNEEEKSLHINGSVTMLNSFYLHRAYLYAYEWAKNKTSLPETITVDKQTVNQEEILKLVKSFDFNRKLFVTIYNCDEIYERVLLNQHNPFAIK
jgi:hypothetical protein